MIQRIRAAPKAVAGLFRKGFRHTHLHTKPRRKPAATGFVGTSLSRWSHHRARKEVVR